MRILQIAPQIPYPPTDGGSLGIYGITKHLSLRGHRITMLCFAPHGKVGNLDELKRYCELVLVPADLKTRLAAVMLNFASQKPFTFTKYHHPSFSTALQWILIAHKFDCIHIDHFQMTSYLPLIRNVFSGPVFLREHSLDSLVFERLSFEQKDPFRRIYFRFEALKSRSMESRILGTLDRCVFITPDEVALAQSYCKSFNASVIPVGVDPSEFFPEDPRQEEPFSMIYFGDLGWIANSQGLLWFVDKILPRVKARYPQAKLFIVGKNPPPRIKRLHSSDVIVTGFVPEVRSWLAKSAVVVVPLQSGGGIKIKVLHAMAMGKAIVTTSIGAEGLDVVDGRHLIIADDPETFASGIIDLIQTPALRTEVGRNARHLVETRYQWSKVAEEFETLYEQTITSHC